MELKCNSNMSTDVALVKSETQESTIFSRGNKKKTITKSNISRGKTKAVQNFKQIYSFNIIIKSCKHRCLLKFPNLGVNALGLSDSLSNK